MKTQKNSIATLVIFPVRKKRWKFYINNNLKDSHSTSRDKLQAFIAEIADPTTVNRSIHFLDKYMAFIIDVKNGYIKRILPDFKKTIEKIRKEKYKEIHNPDKIMKSMTEKKDKNQEIFEKTNNTIKEITNKILNI
jgi:hypothetical protein